MNNDPHHPDKYDHEAGFARPSRRTELLRAAADGELSPADEAALREHLAAHPDDAAVIEFERSLRDRLSTMNAEAPSDALRARVAQLAHDDEPAESIPLRKRPSPLRWLAVAAAFALVSVVTLRFLPSRPALPAPGQLVSEGFRASLCGFVRDRHAECEVHAAIVRDRFRIATLQEAPAAFNDILGAAPDLGAIGAGDVRFVGAMQCAVPGRGTSVHVVLDTVPETEPHDPAATYVSLFVQQDHNELALEPGRTYRMTPIPAAGGELPAEIWVWRKDGLVYFLVSPSEASLEAARIALGALEPTEYL